MFVNVSEKGINEDWYFFFNFFFNLQKLSNVAVVLVKCYRERGCCVCHLRHFRRPLYHFENSISFWWHFVGAICWVCSSHHSSGHRYLCLLQVPSRASQQCWHLLGTWAHIPVRNTPCHGDVPAPLGLARGHCLVSVIKRWSEILMECSVSCSSASSFWLIRKMQKISQFA